MQSLILALALVLTSCHPLPAAAGDPPPPIPYRGTGR